MTYDADNPTLPADLVDPQRRRFLQLMAASTALAGGGCGGPSPEWIVPYADTPPELARSDPLFYATAYTRGGYGYGVLVESQFGRAIKVEGNPDHPASLGATDVFAQASVLELWDPERSHAVYGGGTITTWSAFDAAWLAVAAQLDRNRGAGLRILTDTVTSPTFHAQLQRLIGRYPEARWHSYSAVDPAHASEGARLAFGRALEPVHRLDRARVIVSFDADFLTDGPGAVRYARALADLRRNGAARVRLYTLESTPGLAGAMADERLALSPSEIERVAWRVAALLGAGPTSFPAYEPTARWERAIAAALKGNAGACTIMAGARLTPQTHALVHAMNSRLGNAGRTVEYIAPVAPESATLSALADDMHAGRVSALMLFGVNPVYDAPAPLEFASALEHVPFSAHCGLYHDETALGCRWHLPLPHDYEQWSDTRAYDGTVTVLQPVMRPRHDGRSVHEHLARMAGDAAGGPREIVQRTYRAADARFDARWRDYLRSGVVPETAFRPVTPQTRGAIAPPKLVDAPLVAVFTPSARTYDGRYANNAWLQELPHPMTSLVWDNAVMLGPATARALQIATGDVVRASVDSRTIEAPVYVAPEHAENVATLPLGYGRRAVGHVGAGVGFDAYRLLGATMHPSLSLEPTGARHPLVAAQVHMSTHGRDQVRSATAREFADNPHFAQDEKVERTPEHSLYPEYPYPTYAWGMAIDLNACIGCGACTIACQAENNIPVVGRDEVKHGREMHWIRVDRYRPTDRLPQGAFMPVPCMHCENAPCEPVCPVAATLHDSEGLNLQVYNRCVGTRFCNQNCPYKVRRFNFLKYSDSVAPGHEGARNPEVTVRHRGVMEKCTYCVQRISRARINAQKEGRRVQDGEVVTACQAVCPTRAIHFGDLHDKQSEVSTVKASPLDYALLAELNTRPRTTYLALVRNPDSQLE